MSLVSEMAEDLVVPHAVASEVREFPKGDPSKSWIDRMGKTFVTDPIQINPTVLEWDLGKGESEVLTYVQQNPDFEAIIDDGAARKCAMQLGIPFRGTIGVLLVAKREKKIERVGPKLSQLSEAGLYLDERIIRKALELANEI